MTQAGTVADEAAKLFAAMQDWAARHAPGADGETGEHPAGPASPECRICPVCSTLAVLRSGRPETFEHLLDAAGSLVAALRSALETHERHWARGAAAPVERITIRAPE